MNFKLAIAACLLPGIAGCIGTDVGNPPFAASLTVDAHSSDPDRVAIAVGPGVVVDELWLVVGQTRFVDLESCDEPEMVPPQVVALGALDHAAPELTRQDLTLRQPSYCSVGVELLRRSEPLPSGAPPELADASIVVLGRIPDGTEFVVVSRIETEYMLLATDGSFEMSDMVNDGLFLGFDVAAWLAGIDIASGTPGADGRILIDDATHSDLHALFEMRIAGGLELYRDNDRDGAPDDATPLAAISP